MTPSDEKDSDVSDARKTFIILMFRLVGLFFFFLHLSVVVVNFIGTMKPKLSF